jgi:protein-tyrosine phosphatase
MSDRAPVSGAALAEQFVSVDLGIGHSGTDNAPAGSRDAMSPCRGSFTRELPNTVTPIPERYTLASLGLIDLHAHLIPGIDDGPPDEAGSMEMARIAVENGITAMAATPHIDHSHGVSLQELPERLAAVRSALAAQAIPLEVHQGGEVTAVRLNELATEELRELTLGGGRYVLLECPFTPAGTLLQNAVFKAQSQGFEVLLAHPERSPHFLGHFERLEELVHRGALVQVTAESMTGRFGRTVQQAAIELFSQQLVHVVASDAHDAYKRPPNIARAFAKMSSLLPGIEELMPYWTQTTPAAILAGDEVGAPPEVKRSRVRVLAARYGPRRR